MLFIKLGLKERKGKSLSDTFCLMWHFKSFKIFNLKNWIQTVGQWNNLHLSLSFMNLNTVVPNKHAFALYPVYVTTEKLQLILHVTVACDTGCKQKEWAVTVIHQGKEKHFWKENTVRWKYYTRKSLLLQEQRNTGIDSAVMLHPQDQDLPAPVLPSRSHFFIYGIVSGSCCPLRRHNLFPKPNY